MEAAADCETGKDIILQEWNGFGFKFIEKQDHSKVLAQMEQNFYIDEPISKFTGLSPERKLELDERLTNIMNLNHGSFYAYPLDDPDKVACVLLIWFQEKERPSLPMPQKLEDFFPLWKNSTPATTSMQNSDLNSSRNCLSSLLISNIEGKGLPRKCIAKQLKNSKRKDSR